MAPAAKHICYTNFDMDTAINYNDDIMSYMVYQEEISPTTGQHHIQGYMVFKKKRTVAWLKANIHPTAHYEFARGTPEDNRKYCTKEDSYVEGTRIELGVLPRGSGTRSDLTNFFEAVREGATESSTRNEFYEVWAKYPNWCRSEHDRRRTERLERYTPEPEPVRPWQSTLKGELDGRVDSRKVIWYCDFTGGAGKSTFARRYTSPTNTPGLDRNGGYIVNGGQHRDIYYAYRGQRVVFFDWSRDHQETFPYTVIENFKNGYFLSTKYEAREVRFRPPHVVVFANWEPDRTKLSGDRWDIRYINEEGTIL